MTSQTSQTYQTHQTSQASRTSPTRVLFVWPGLTGYMGDCWRTLAEKAQVKVLVDGTGLGKDFTDEVMSGIDWERVTADDVIAKTLAFAPDAIVVVGWRRALPRKIAFAPELDVIPKILVMDMPWRWSIRCIAARFVLRRYLRRFRGIFVHGAPSARYARWLGFKEDEIHRHCICGINLEKFLGDDVGDRAGFLFVGRKVKEKGIETLKAAYERYREDGGTWNLTMPEWIDPKDVPQLMREHACLVLPSVWEPWGVVVAEAKAAGMKIIVSDRVMSRFDVPCDEIVKAGDVKALAEAMRKVEVGVKSWSGRGTAIRELSCERWAERVVRIVEELS